MATLPISSPCSMKSRTASPTRCATWASSKIHWEFGDGARASGVSVTHAYAEAGTYMLKLTVSSESGQRIVGKQINVVTRPVTYRNPYAGYQGTGDPPHNPKVVLPTPDDTLSDRIASSPAEIGKKIPSTPTPPAMKVPLALIVSGSVALVVIILVIIGGTIFLHRRRS
ncbi:MAG: PKD domain-containing protein [Ktedonobacteraceae bacterium]|nr:PKD domain-containing protein [Ktedonobacteraceae bacterium]